MKLNNLHYIVLICVISLANIDTSRGQDQLPANLSPQHRIADGELLSEYKSESDTIAFRVTLPETFVHTTANLITDNYGILTPIYERMHQLKKGTSADTLRIVHIGDSHVRGRIFPRTVGLKFTEIFGAVSYTDMGVNGATCLTFTHPERIAAIEKLKPELLILSFGTNESHNKRYNATIHYNQMDELVKLIRARMPDVPILWTTPPGSYESFRQQRRRRTYAINPRTVTTVHTMLRYADKRQLAVWDMYTIAGGKDYACKNWQEAGLMRPDHIHYMPDAYIFQGEWLFEALINAYNAHVSH